MRAIASTQLLARAFLGQTSPAVRDGAAFVLEPEAEVA
jgi:hypothetical protein